MTRYRMTSAQATQQAACALAEMSRAGDLVLLIGEMGAGKTVFAKGFAVGLGVTEPVTSPTFTLVRHYEGRLPMYHIDVYRLDTMAEVGDLGLSELLDSGGVTLIEWGDAIVAALPLDYVEIRLAFDEDIEHRSIEVRVVGPSWASRRTMMTEALEPWRC